jgi:FkbM family methyltransferase
MSQELDEGAETKSMFSSSLRWTGRLIQNLGNRLAEAGGIKGTWIDVGAHCGETSLRWALQNPGLKVYAVEPNLAAAVKLMSRLPNYLVIPMAVAEMDGFADFYVNAFEGASSMLQFNSSALSSWAGGESLKVKSVINVPTIRLDTFMALTGIRSVDYLKIDTQGMDLAVVRSAGTRLRDIAKITLEVDIKEVRLYSGAPTKDEVVTFLSGAGFSLASVDKQTYGQEENLTFTRGTTFAGGGEL